MQTRLATNQKIERLRRDVLSLLKPPARLKLSEWIENSITLWDGPQVGQRFRLWPQQREIADEIGSPDMPLVTIKKSVRGGYTKTLIAGIGATAASDPCDMILLVPTDDDARGFAVDEVEPCFSGSKQLKHLIGAGRIDGRNTLTIKKFVGGGSLKILSARSPRKLRRHDAKKLFVDEEDGMEITSEGDPIVLAEKRTFAHADRKIVRGSTPTVEGTSTISKAYAQSDQRIYQVPCPHCGVFFEVLWQHIRWPKGQPDEAVCVCPQEECSKPIEERFKTQMVANGHWHKQRPDVVGHAGFRFNALISFFANARWSVLAKEYEKAVRQGPAELQVFTNTMLGLEWKQTLDSVDEATLLERTEDFGIRPDPADKTRNRFPSEVLAVVAGVDTQDDRFEIVLWGLNESEAFMLSHDVIWGDPADSTTQAELDIYLRSTWLHPNGWQIGIEAVAIDSQGHKTTAVYDFCRPRLPRKIYAIISRDGPRKIWAPAKKKQKGEVRLMIVGHDQIKTLVMQRIAIPPIDEKTKLPNAHRFRYSADLDPDTFDQLTGEKRIVRYQRGNKTVMEFKSKKPGQRVEALDCTCYALAVAHSIRVNWSERRARKGAAPLPRRSLADLSATINR